MLLFREKALLVKLYYHKKLQCASKLCAFLEVLKALAEEINMKSD